MNLYPRIAKWGGAGALVPITGFANSVAAPAIEYKKEGQVFGIRLHDLHDRRSAGHPVRDRYKQRACVLSTGIRRNNGSGLMPLPLFFLFLLLMSIYTG